MICTNAYLILGIRFVKKFMHYYKGSHDILFYLFTDKDVKTYLPDHTNVHAIQTVHKNWVDGTNSKFSNILKLRDTPCDYLYYFDADTNITQYFTEEWFIGDVVAGEHYNNRYLDKTGKPIEKGYDRNPKSKAYIPYDTLLPQTYYYGAFFGGKREKIITFCEKLVEYQQSDAQIQYEPVWNDESYINNYFHFNPPSRTVASNEFMFVVSDKGGFGDMRNVALDTQKYLDEIAKQPRQIFEIRNNKIVFQKSSSLGVMYGPYICKDIPVEVVKKLDNGELVYMVKHDSYIKMVSGSGKAKYYKGEFSDFKSKNWQSYTDVGTNYMVKFLSDVV